MDYYSFIGLLVVGLGIVVGLFFAVHNPLSRIESNQAETNVKLDNINKTLEGHNDTLKDHERRISKNEGDIKSMKTKKHGGK
jgi:predicted  nucleic acid-binding Zn-ribbon protein